MKRSGQFLWLLFLIAWLFPAGINGQTKKDVDDDVAGVKKEAAPVKMDGKILFFVSGISSYPAELRAETISKRIKKAAQNPLILVDSILVHEEGDHYWLYAGREFIMNIYSNDAQAEGVSINLLAELIKSKVKESVTLYRHNRTNEALLGKSFIAVGATVLFTISIILIRFLTGWINRVMTRRLKTSVDLLENKSKKVVSSVQFWKTFNILFRSIKWLLTVILTLFFIIYVLELFPWTSSFGFSAYDAFINPVSKIGRAILNYIPSFIFLIIIITITRYLLNLLKLFFSGIGTGAIVVANFYPEWAIPTFKLVRIGIIAFAIILAFPYIPGSKSEAFKGVSLFMGVLFSLGSSSFISNIIAGYSMTYRRAFRLGDLIEADGHTGFVEEQKLLVTRLRSQKNEEIIIPNSTLLNSHIVNYSAKVNEKGLVIHTIVGIGYETPWRQVVAMLILAADRTEGLQKEPPPYVLKRSLGDFAVNYEINAFVKDVSRINLHYTHLHQNILDVFNENNVQIMTPAYEGDPQTPKVVPRDQWDVPLNQ